VTGKIGTLSSPRDALRGDARRSGVEERAVRDPGQSMDVPAQVLKAVGLLPGRPSGDDPLQDALELPPPRSSRNHWTNALGFNDGEFVVPKPAGRFRIMAVEDSFTYPSALQVDARLRTALIDRGRGRRGHAELTSDTIDPRHPTGSWPSIVPDCSGTPRCA
jgi:hypothetical protein